MTTLDGGVIIKKGEGGGSTPPSGGDNGGVKLYYTKSSAFTATDLQCAVSAKIKGTGVLSTGTMIGMIVDLETTLSNITAIMVSPTRMVLMGTDFEVNQETLREMYKDGFTEITEEEFYTLD